MSPNLLALTTARLGAVAQLVAHLVRIEGVRGSSPLSSTHLTESGLSHPPPASVEPALSLICHWHGVTSEATKRFGTDDDARGSGGTCLAGESGRTSAHQRGVTGER